MIQTKGKQFYDIVLRLEIRQRRLIISRMGYSKHQRAGASVSQSVFDHSSEQAAIQRHAPIDSRAPRTRTFKIRFSFRVHCKGAF